MLTRSRSDNGNARKESKDAPHISAAVVKLLEASRAEYSSSGGSQRLTRSASSGRLDSARSEGKGGPALSHKAPSCTGRLLLSSGH